MARSKVSESRLWAWLSKARKELGEGLHMCRIENGVMAGMPDVEACWKGEQFWMELKCVARPARPYTKIKLKFQPQQLPWIRRRSLAGGAAYVLAQVASGHDASRYLVPSYCVDKLEAGLTEAQLQRISVINGKASATDIVRAATKF